MIITQPGRGVSSPSRDDHLAALTCITPTLLCILNSHDVTCQLHLHKIREGITKQQKQNKAREGPSVTLTDQDKTRITNDTL